MWFYQSILTKIYNQCVIAGSFSDFQNDAEVILFYKAGSKNICSNYCPISLLSPFAEIFERCLHFQLYNDFTFCLHAASFVLHFATLVPFLHRSSIIIFYTLSVCIPCSSAIILTVRRQLLCTFCLTCSTFSSVLLVDGLPLLWSFSTSLPSLNLLCHSKRWVLDNMPSP